MTPDWMEWDGWRWIAIAGALAVGRWWGWTARGSHDRARRREARNEVYRRPSGPGWPPPRDPPPPGGEA